VLNCLFVLKHSLRDLTVIFADVLSDLNLVANDVIAGLMLLKQSRRVYQQLMVAEVYIFHVRIPSLYFHQNLNILSTIIIIQ